MTTKYEIVAKKEDTQVTLAFTARKTKKSLFFNMRDNADAIISTLGTDENATVEKATAKELVLSDGTRVFFSGRTKLDVIGRV